jgi:ABC-2 type transport system ATP-binding protein
MPHVIETRGLTRSFGPKLAVADLTLSVEAGEVFGFLGPNGAGKTTSVKMLLGLIEPSSGTGQVLGRPLGDRLARSRLGFLPEHFRFQEWLTGRELLDFHGRLFGLSGVKLRNRIDELLGLVDLFDAAHRAIRTYSKGMMQRIGLAQAMLNEPALILLDEPTSGLDPLGRLMVRDIIHGLRESGTTVFLNSHLLGEVEATCDRVAFVKEGRTVREMKLGEAGVPSALSGVEVELRLGDAPGRGEALAGLERFGSDVAQVNGIVHLRVASEERLPEIARWLVERRVPIYEIRPVKRSLEQLFLEVMGDDQRPG